MMKRGQAFDTFKLMIAAVVAVAILGILLGIIQQIQPTVQQQPVQISQNLINTALNAPCAPIPSGEVNFKRGDGWVGNTFLQSSGHRATNVVTRCDSSVSGLFDCGSGANDLSSASVDFPGGITAMCYNNECVLTVYTVGATGVSPQSPTGC